MKEIMESIRYNNGTFPRKELQQIIEREEEAIPHLLQILEEVKDNPKKYLEEPSRIDFIYALYLLSQFRVKALTPILIEILCLPDGMPDELLGDTITEGIGRMLATVYDGDIQPIQQLIENPEVDDFVRGQGVHCLAMLVFSGRLERESVLNYFHELFNGRLTDVNHMLNAQLVSSCNDLYPEELYEDIVRIFDEGKIDTMMINLDDVDRTLQMSNEKVLEINKQDHHYQLINDAISEMEGWACFEESKVKRKTSPTNLYSNQGSYPKRTNPAVKVKKIGRNDPCLCGSGKKNKKCCDK
jgi:hypothetical protein